MRYVGHMGTDEDIVADARMSTDADFRGWETDANFLDYLYRSRHTSPFEGCTLKIEVQLPIVVVRQWHRHRTQSYNEVSGRYVELPELYYLPARERWAGPSDTHKQGSGVPLDSELAGDCRRVLHRTSVKALDGEVQLRENGAASELARLGTTINRYTRMRATANLHNWLNFLRLRLAPDAQAEIRAYADAVALIVQALWPRSYAAFEEHTLYARTFSRTELVALRAFILESAHYDTADDHAVLQSVAREHGLSQSRTREFVEKLWPAS